MSEAEGQRSSERREDKIKVTAEDGDDGMHGS